jgi:hypothetical protein
MSAIETKGFDKAYKFFEKLPGDVRFATSRAINDIAVEVQKETVNHVLPDKFTLRSKGAPWFKPGNRFGFNAKFSSKDNLQATVGSQADWLKLQEEGGTKQIAGHRLAIPSTEWKPKPEIMAANKKPRAILEDIAALQKRQAELQIDRRHARIGMTLDDRRKQHAAKEELRGINKRLRAARSAQKAEEGLGGQTGGKAFVATMKSGFTGIFKRLGPKSRPLKLLFAFSKLAKIEPNLHWHEAAKAVINERYDEAFTKRLKEAIKPWK